MAAWNELPATGGLDECAALVHSAETLRFSTPELAVQLARRALLVGASVTGADPGVARSLSMRGQAVLAVGLVAVNRHVEAIAPAAAALGFAERGGAPDLATAMRLDLAACAREVGEPLVGSTVLRPVLTDGRARPSVRGRALGRLVGCVAPIARRDDVEDAIVEADRLLAADDALSVDDRRLERARLAVRTAAYHRWYGDVEDAVEVSRDGLSVLARVRDQDATSGRLRARLVLELVCSLLDSGELDEAESVARPVIDEPARATSALPVGRIMLAVSTRVHLPGGRVDQGRFLLDRAVLLAERHGLDSLLADALTTVSQLDERADRLAESLAALQSARAAEQRRLLAVAKASRVLLTEIDHGGRRTVHSAAAANALLRQVLKQASGVPDAVEVTQQLAAVPPVAAPDTDEATGLLDGDGLARRLRAVRTGERPVALTLVRLEHDEQERGSGDLTELAHQVRSLAPAGAELARPAGAELAVLLPHTTLDQAEQLAATIGRTAIASADANGRAVTVSTGAAQSGEDTGALLTDARHALTRAERPDAMVTDARDALTRSERSAAMVADALTRSHQSEALLADGHDALTRSERSAALLGDARDALIRAERPEGMAAEARDAFTRAHGSEAMVTDPRDEQTSAERSEAIARHTTTATPAEHAAESNGTAIRRGLDLAGARESLTVGRSILNSLSIPSGSGGRRRADPAMPEEPLPAASREASPTDSWSGDEATKDELATMMSALSAGTLRVPPSPAAGARNGTRAADRSHPARQTLPTPPQPDDVPTPPSRPDVPDPGEPTPVPQPPPEPTEPQPLPDAPASWQLGHSREPLPQREAAPSWSSPRSTAAELAALWSSPAPADPLASWTTGSRDTADSTDTASAAGSSAADSLRSWSSGSRKARESAEPAESRETGSHAADEPTPAEITTTEGTGASDPLTSWAGGWLADRGIRPAHDSTPADTAGPASWRTGSRPAHGSEPEETGSAGESWSSGSRAARDIASAKPTSAADTAAPSPSWRTGSRAARDSAGVESAVGADAADPLASWRTGSRAARDSAGADAADPLASWRTGSRAVRDTAPAESAGTASSTDAAAALVSWRSGSREARGTAAGESAQAGADTAAAEPLASWGSGWRADRDATGTASAAGDVAEPLASWGSGWRADRGAESAETPAEESAPAGAGSTTGEELAALWAIAENAERGAAAAPADNAAETAVETAVSAELAALWAGASRADQSTEQETAGPTEQRRGGTTPAPAPRAPNPADAVKPTDNPTDARTSTDEVNPANAVNPTDAVNPTNPTDPAKPADAVRTPADASGPVLGPPVRPAEQSDQKIPRAERSDSTTIAGLLAEALAAYQSSVDEERAEAAPETADPIAEFQQRTGAAGRHRSPE